MATFKATTGSDPTPQGKKFESNFNKTMTQYGVNLSEVDSNLNEVEQSLKKKIFSLAKMEALVFSDPKLSAVYEEMAENGEEKYGYHYNETIQNMIFNDYVLNSPKYLQKYKQAQPKEKKRRDKSGINQLKKKGEEMQTRNLVTKPAPKPVSERYSFNPNQLGITNGMNWEADVWNALESKYNMGMEDVVNLMSAQEQFISAKHKEGANPNDVANELWNMQNNNISEEDGGAIGGAPVGATNSSSSGQYTGPLSIKKQIPEELEDYDIDNRPDTLDPDGDCIISSNGWKYSLSCGGAFEGEFGEIEDALARVREWKKENHYYPNTWFVSDHGNESLIDDEGNIINETTGSASSGAYSGPAMWGSGDLMKTSGKANVKKVPMVKGGTIIGENYLVDPKGFEKFIETLSEGIDEIETPMDAPIIDKTSAFSSNTVHNWNVPDTKLEYDTLKSGAPDQANFESMEENLNEFIADAIIGSDVVDIQPRSGEVPFMLNGSKWEFETATYNNGKKDIVVYSYKDDIYYDYLKWREAMGIDKNTQTMNETKKIDEKAKSKSQQQLFGMAHAVQKGELPASKVGGAVKKIAKDVSPKDVEDFASTKHKGLPEKVDEDAQSMIGDSPDTMANKPTPIGQQSANIDQGVRSSGPMGESYEALLEEINKELDAFSIHHDKLKRMAEDRKPSALVLRDRVGSENEKNFKSDLKDSSVSKIVDIENSLEYKDQQSDVKDPQKLGQNIEKQAIKTGDMKSGEALKNVGDSANDKGDEIPKRNLSDDEQDEVNMYRLGLGDLVYDNEVGKRFEDRMKADMGEKLYAERLEKLKFRAKAPMYNKDIQPTEGTGVNKVQFDKEQSGWNEREGIKESLVSGKYVDELGKKRFVHFNLNEVLELKSIKRVPELTEITLEGIGNTYTQKVNVNESVVKAMGGFKFFTNGSDIFALKNPTQTLNETALKTKPVMNEQMDKMKHLVNYNTKDFIKQSKI